MSAPVFMYEKQKNAKTCTGSCLQPAFTADSVGEDFWTVNILQFKQIRRAGGIVAREATTFFIKSTIIRI